MKDKNPKIIIGLVVALVLCITAIYLIQNQSATTSESNTKVSTSFKIMFTNDIHGRISNDTEQPSFGYARIAQMKEDLAAEGDVLLFSAGDVIQGTPYVSETEGESAFELMNLAGYDAMTPGNHDFNLGADHLLELGSQVDFELLCANVLDDSSEYIFAANTVYTLNNGVRVGVFGLTTPSTKTSASPTAVENLNFLADEQLYEEASKQVAQLQDQDCDVIVCLSHLGIDDNTEGSRSYDVIENVEGMDIVIDAHSHVVLNEMQGDTLLVSTGAFGENFGVATYVDGKFKAEMIPAVQEDEETSAYAEEVVYEVDEALNIPLAKTQYFLDGEYETVRVSETNLGDLSTDAMLWYMNNNSSVQADVALMNSGSIRSSIDVGEISLMNVKEVFPYGNTLVTLDVTGAQLLEALEAASAELPEHTAPMAQVAGITYTVNTGVEYVPGELYPETTFYAPQDSGSRVQITSVGEQPFSLTDVYTIVTIDFLAAGGDSYYVFTQGENAVDSGVLMEDAFAAYIDVVMEGSVDSRYELPAGRIVIN